MLRLSGHSDLAGKSLVLLVRQFGFLGRGQNASSANTSPASSGLQDALPLKSGSFEKLHLLLLLFSAARSSRFKRISARNALLLHRSVEGFLIPFQTNQCML